MYKKDRKYLSAGTAILNSITFSRQIEFILALLLSLLFLSCEAPKSNPLDPMNSINSGMGTLEGTVQTHSIPGFPIKDVSVFWVPGGRNVKTDSAGYFIIRNIETVNGKLIVEKEGYASDTLTINWSGLKNVTKQINLTRQPEIDSVSIYTVIENRSSDEPDSYLVIVIALSDPDNIVSSVTVNNPELNVNKKLRYIFTGNNTNTILDTLSLNELKVPDIEQAIGTDFNLLGRNQVYNKEHLFKTERITRVIKDLINPISPVNNAVVGTIPELRWQAFNPGYTFSYMVEIYTTDQINPRVVRAISNISSSVNSVRLTQSQPLERGDYYWVVWVIDKFGNRVRSIPAGFTVQ